MRNSPASTRVREEGWEGGAPAVPREDRGKTDISLGLVERTMVEQIFTLQPMEDPT